MKKTGCMEGLSVIAVELSNDRINDFVNYCKRHRTDVDDSFLYDEDLEKFQVDQDNPTYIIIDNNDKIVAAASLILDEYNRSGKKGRFRIFHSELNEISLYESLLQGILNHTEGLERIFTFVPTHNQELMDNIVGLNFKTERYIFLLVSEVDNIPEINLPNDYTIRPLELNSDEENWCQVRNAAFATVKGNETPVTTNMVKDMILGTDNLEGGCMILYHKDNAVGCIRCSYDDYEDSPIVNIGALAVIPEYQGKGLGRLLLRAGMNFAKNKSYSRTILCVNADNEKAKTLYIQEGYKQVEAVVCYYYEV